MQIYPAIDLIDGKCVRLQKGDFTARTDYSDDPLSMSHSFAAAGATWLHLVDLDGSRDTTQRQLRVIARIVAATSLKVQTGGGVRLRDDVDRLLSIGAARVVIGSLSVQNPELTMDILREYGREKIALALDVRGDFAQGFYVATSGWQETSPQRLDDVLTIYKDAATHILCTDISRDGMLQGPNIALYQYLCDRAPNFQIQASGGVTTIEDIKLLQQTGVAGAVIGKALYEQRFTLENAIAAVKQC